MTEDKQGGLAFRNPVKRRGYAIVHHVLTLDQDLSDGSYRLYALLLKYARDSEGCWPGIKRLADDLGKSEQTIERRLGELVGRGLISRQQRLNQTAMTYIEDLEDVYEPVPLKNEEDVPLIFEGDMSPSKMRGKEETEGETDKKGVVVSKQEQEQGLAILRSFGVSEPVARKLAGLRSLEDVQGWVAYTQSARGKGIQEPQAFVVARLRDGEPAPEEPEESGNGDRSRYIGGKYADCIRH